MLHTCTRTCVHTSVCMVAVVVQDSVLAVDLRILYSRELFCRLHLISSSTVAPPELYWTSLIWIPAQLYASRSVLGHVTRAHAYTIEMLRLVS